MPYKDALKRVLDVVFGGTDPMDPLKDTNVAYMDFWVVPGNQGPRWIIPCSARLGLSVLREWHPYNFSSRLKWTGLICLYACRLLGRAPKVTTLRLNIEGVSPTRPDGFAPVVYVGSPGPQQKAVVTLVNQHSGAPQSVLKVALEDGAIQSIQREAQVLMSLRQHEGVVAPTLLWVDASGGRSCQSVVPGKLTGRTLTKVHAAWLASLPRTGQMTTLDQRREVFAAALVNCLPEEASLIKLALEGLGGSGPIPEILVHGDFAPWNLKWQRNGKIAAIDWEEARFNGMPLHDLCHFYSIQAHLFGGGDVFSELTKSPLSYDYLKEVGVGSLCLKPLLLHYLLTMVAGLGGVCSEDYRRFLLAQIRAVIES